MTYTSLVRYGMYKERYLHECPVCCIALNDQLCLGWTSTQRLKTFEENVRNITYIDEANRSDSEPTLSKWGTDSGGAEVCRVMFPDLRSPLELMEVHWKQKHLIENVKFNLSEQEQGSGGKKKCGEMENVSLLSLLERLKICPCLF